MEKLAHIRRKGTVKIYEGRREYPTAEPYDTHPEHPAPVTEAEPLVAPGSGESARIKVRDSAYGSSSANHSRTDADRFEQSQVKTRDAHIQRQGKGVQFKKQKSAANDTALPGRQPAQPVGQGRQKFIQERQVTTVRQSKGQRGMERVVTARQRDKLDIPLRKTSTLFGQPENKPAKKVIQETVSGSKRQIKTIRSGVEVTERTPRQTIKTAEFSSRQMAQAAGAGVKAAQATAQTRRQTIQAAGATARVASTSVKAVAKTVVSATKAAAAAARGLAATIAAGGGAVVAVVLVLCLAGALLLSPLGIFFSGEDSGTGQTMANAVREINKEYADRLEEIEGETAHDQVELSRFRAPWTEVLAVYAVKTTSDPTNGQEVVTMDDTKKELLKQIFWDMNQLSSLTSTVPNEDGEGQITTLYITVTAKTAGEMADEYAFTAEQRRQLAELLSDDYQSLWNSILYGSGMGDSEIVAVALSQVGNVGGQPYWSWYGFDHRVDWCAIFVSWCANECGYIEAGVVPKFAGCVQGSRWFKERELWQDRSYTPNPGDVIFFDWDDSDGLQDSVPDHVGIVERVEDGRVYTVEGNSGDKCCQRSYPLGYYEIYGYGIM